MTEPLTPEEIEEVRTVHSESCALCEGGPAWCDTARLLATLEAANAAPAGPRGLQEAIELLRSNERWMPNERFWEGWDAALAAVEIAARLERKGR